MIRERNYCLDRLALCELCVSIPAATAIGGVVGGGLQAGGSIAAANINASAANTAAANQMSMFNQTRASLAPFIGGGGNAFANMSNMMGMGGPNASANMLAGLRNYPGYQFALQQGQLGVDRSDAAKGLLLSGGQLKDTMNYNQGMADQLFGNYFNQNMNMAQLGENAAAGAGQQGLSASQYAGNAGMAGAGAVGTGIYNAGSTLGNAFSNAMQGYAMQSANDNNAFAGYANGNWTPGPQGFPMAA